MANRKFSYLLCSSFSSSSRCCLSNSNLTTQKLKSVSIFGVWNLQSTWNNKLQMKWQALWKANDCRAHFALLDVKAVTQASRVACKITKTGDAGSVWDWTGQHTALLDRRDSRTGSGRTVKTLRLGLPEEDGALLSEETAGGTGQTQQLIQRTLTRECEMCSSYWNKPSYRLQRAAGFCSWGRTATTGRADLYTLRSLKKKKKNPQNSWAQLDKAFMFWHCKFSKLNLMNSFSSLSERFRKQNMGRSKIFFKCYRKFNLRPIYEPKLAKNNPFLIECCNKNCETINEQNKKKDTKELTISNF